MEIFVLNEFEINLNSPTPYSQPFFIKIVDAAEL